MQLKGPLEGLPKFGHTDDGSTAPKRLRADPTLGRAQLIFSGCKGSNNGTMKTRPRPRTVPLLLRVCYWFSCRKVRMQKSLATECSLRTQPGSGSSSLTVESFLRESGSVAKPKGFSSNSDLVESFEALQKVFLVLLTPRNAKAGNSLGLSESTAWVLDCTWSWR